MGTEMQRDFLDALIEATGKLTLSKIAMNAAIEENGGEVDFNVADAVQNAIEEAEYILDKEVFHPLTEWRDKINTMIRRGRKAA